MWYFVGALGSTICAELIRSIRRTIEGTSQKRSYVGLCQPQRAWSS